MTQPQTLPAQKVDQRKADIEAEVPLKPLRLLHVEDNRADALLTQEYIRAVLPNVEFDDAVRLSDVTPELVATADCTILDLSLPDAEGLEALVALRAMSEAIPIIVLTGFDDLELGLGAVRDGADDYLIKNHIDSYTLERAVQYSIERRSLMRDLISSAAETAAAAAATYTADAALDAATQRALDSFDEGWAASGADDLVAVGTHQVAVRINETTGDYTLACQTCAWQSADVTDDVHSWASRSLDVALLRHVTVGDEDQLDAPREPPADHSARGLIASGVEKVRAVAHDAAEEPFEPVSRRAALSPKRWLG